MHLSDGETAFSCTSTLGFGVSIEVETSGVGIGLCVSTRDARQMVIELCRAITNEENANATNQSRAN